LGACTDTRERDENYLRKNNLNYSQTLVKWCRKNNKFFHYASSAAIYGDGKKGYSDDPGKVKEYKALNLYGESKRLFDQIKQSGKVQLFATTRKGHEDGSEERDFVYVKDVRCLTHWARNHKLHLYPCQKSCAANINILPRPI